MTNEKSTQESQAPLPSEEPVIKVEQRQQAESSQDPLRILTDIVQNPKIHPDDKNTLIEFSKNRFRNRRRMAYWAIYALIFAFAFLFIGAFIDGISNTEILSEVSNNQSIITWFAGFLTAIVGTYFGVSSLRPSS